MWSNVDFIPNSNGPIASICCMWHTVLAWNIKRSDITARNEIMMKWNFNRIWTVIQELLEKWILVPTSFNSSSRWTNCPPFWQTKFRDTFSWMKMTEFRIKFHWNLFPGLQLTINPHWFMHWLGADQATSHYLNQCWPSTLTRILSNYTPHKTMNTIPFTCTNRRCTLLLKDAMAKSTTWLM